MSKTLDMKISEGRQYRDFNSINLEAKEDSENMIVEGYATIFNQPYELFSMDGYRVLEQIDGRAFTGCDMSDVIMQYNHEGRVFARNSNNTLSTEVDDKGLHIRADLSGTELGRGLYTEIAGGYTDKMSFGFTVEEDDFTEKENEDGTVDVLRTVLRINKLYDVSAVSIPANNATSITARSFSEGVIAELKAERLKKEKRRRQLQKIRILSEV